MSIQHPPTHSLWPPLKIEKLKEIAFSLGFSISGSRLRRLRENWFTTNTTLN
jgi:hypothetical protein